MFEHSLRDWFTVEQLDPDTYAISEYGHWEQPHCYLLLGTQRALLIDTGLGVADLRAVVVSLTDLPVTAALTHAHWDHMGGLEAFERIAVHESEAPWLTGQFPLPLSVVQANLTQQPCNFPTEFCLEDYRMFQGQPQCLLHDGDCISLGGREITVLHTPGHSPGHCCFYELRRQYLYSGDLIYEGCLDAFYPTTDPMHFWQSVQRLCSLPVKRILPGHHRLDVPVSRLKQVELAFAELFHQGKLRQGGGLFDFGTFQIHL